MLGGIEPILHLAEAGAIDLGRASDLVTDSMAALGLEVQDLEGYLDKVAQTSRKSNTDIDQLMEAMVIAGGTFSRFNVPLEEANSFLGVLANRGFKGSEAGTALNAIMTRLTASTGPSAKALKELGVSAFDSGGNFRGMEVVMKDVEKSLSGLDDEQRAHYQTQIAGLNHGKSFSAMLSGLGNEYDDLKGEVIDSNGALRDMRDIMKDNLQGALENLNSAFEEIMISIGSALLPAVKLLVAGLQRLADWFNSLSDRTKSFIAIGAAVASVLMIVGGGLLMLIGFIPAILSGFAALKTVAVAVGTAIAGISLPVAAVIAALVGLAIVVIKYWKPIKKFFVNLWKTVSKAFKDGFNYIDRITHGWLRNGLAVYKAWFKTIVDLVKRYWRYIKETFSNALAFLKALIKLDFGGMKDAIGAQMDSIKSLLGDSWKIIKDRMTKPLKELGKSVRKTFTGVYDWINDKTNGFFGYYIGIWKAQAKTIVGVATAWWSYIKESFSNALDFLKGLVTLDFKLIGESIKNQLETSKTFVTDAWTEIKDNIGKKIAEIGRDIKAKLPEWRDAIIEWFKGLPGKIGAQMNEWREKIAGKLEEIKETITTKVNEWKERALNWVEGIPGRLSDKIEDWKTAIGDKLDEIKDTFSEKLEVWQETVIGWFEDMPDNIITTLESWRDAIVTWTEEQDEENKIQFGKWTGTISAWFLGIPDEISTWLGEWMAEISSWYDEVKEEISKKLETWGSTIAKWFTSRPDEIGKELGKWWTKMSTWFSKVPEKIGRKLGEWWQTIKDWFNGLSEKKEIKDAGKNMVDKMSEGNEEKRQEFIDKLGKLIVDVVLAALAFAGVAIVAAGREIIKRLIDGLTGEEGFLKRIVRSIGAGVASTFSSVNLFSIGRNIIQGLISGVGSMAMSLWNKARSIAAGIASAISGRLEVNSPSRVAYNIAKWVPIGMANALTDYAKYVDRASIDLAEAATPNMREIDLSYATPNGIRSSLASAVNGTVDVNSRDDMLASAIDNLGDKLENLRIEMDSREFGRMVSDTATRERNESVRGGGRRRI